MQFKIGIHIYPNLPPSIITIVNNQIMDNFLSKFETLNPHLIVEASFKFTDVFTGFYVFTVDIQPIHETPINSMSINITKGVNRALASFNSSNYEVVKIA